MPDHACMICSLSIEQQLGNLLEKTECSKRPKIALQVQKSAWFAVFGAFWYQKWHVFPILWDHSKLFFKANNFGVHHNMRRSDIWGLMWVTKMYWTPPYFPGCMRGENHAAVLPRNRSRNLENRVYIPIRSVGWKDLDDFWFIKNWEGGWRWVKVGRKCLKKDMSKVDIFG